MLIRFAVPGQPQGKGRPKFSTIAGHASARTPEKTVVYENLIRMQYQSAVADKRFPDDAPLMVTISTFYQMPKSSRKKTEQMLSGEIRPITKPDWDNVGKVVCDALNTIAYKDDSRIVDASVRKFYSARPRVEVTISDEF